MVARSRVLNAARTADIVLSRRLTADSLSAREFQ
jgi:hypothetical protein